MDEEEMVKMVYVQKDGVDIPTHHGVVALAGWEED